MTIPRSRTQQQAAGRSAGEPYTQKLAPGVYGYVQPDGGWCLSNAGIIVGRDAVVLVDTAATEARTRALSAAVAELTPLAPTMVINTHHHGDHHFGNALFAPRATVVAHEATRAVMADKGLALRQVWPATDWGDLELTLPTLTFGDDGLSVRVDGLRVELIHLGLAHTESDTVVWIPEHRVLFAGDVLMPGCTPFVLAGSVEGSLRAVEKLRALGPRSIVGGHGPVAGPEALDEARAYLLWVRDLAARGLAAGLTPYQAAEAADLGDFARLRDPERLVANLHRAYVEARGLPPATQIRSAPVFAEMARLNGGRPAVCLA
jgi:cyclase